MPDTRRRKVPKDEYADAKRKTKSAQNTVIYKSSRSTFYFLAAFVFTFCIGAYFYLFHWSSSYTHSATLLDTLSLTLGLKNYIHSIVIDAGSTGSRILSYGFVSSPTGNSLKLHKEFFKEIKPGISAYANNPSESIKTLDSLLKEVKSRIPEEDWSKTSLIMKATAGLRLLPNHQAESLLNQARQFLRKSGFKVENDAVSILDGRDEGLLSWFTVNFLLDRFGDDISKTVVALDLGGGSTQVSFVPSINDVLTQSQSVYLNKIEAFHKELDVFSRSYLGLGLNEGRKRILLHNSNHSTTIQSECINPLVNTKWSYGGVEYSVKGPKIPHYSQTSVKGDKFVTPIVDFKECEKVVKNVVGKFEKAPSLAGKDIYAFSYYYDRAADSGLIEFKKSGIVTIKELMAMAKSKCNEANVDQPFMCLDLIYICTLLRDLFSIPDATKINLVKWLNGHEVSWALGAAFLNLQSQYISPVIQPVIE